MQGNLSTVARTGRKRKFRGSSLRKEPAARKPDDRLLASEQPHRRWLPVAHRLSEKASSMLGCLNLKGLISDEEHEAGRLYSVSLGAYRSVIGGPGGTAGNGQGYDCQPIGCKLETCECFRRTENYLSARIALSEAGDVAMQSVERLIIDDQWPVNISDAKCGLSKLMSHFGLTNGRKSWQRRNTN